MFSRKEQIIKKTGPNGVGRYQFLSLLIQEFQKSTSLGKLTTYLSTDSSCQVSADITELSVEQKSRSQVLANLANFSYDPINYEFIRQLNLINIFLNELSGGNEELIHYSLAGLCSLSPDPRNGDFVIKNNGIFLVSQFLLHRNVEISLNALSILIFLITPESHASITTPEIIIKALHYQASSNPRLKNLGTIFLEDYCTPEQIDYAKKSSNLDTVDIPLPT